MDKNQAVFSGRVERFAIVQTKTQTPMIRVALISGKELVDVVAFRTLAEETRLRENDEIEVAGAIRSNGWVAKDGGKHYGWQLVATSIEILAKAPRREAAAAAPQRQTERPVQTVPAGVTVPF